MQVEDITSLEHLQLDYIDLYLIHLPGHGLPHAP